MDLLLPVGRLVGGSLYEGQTTDAENKPLVYQSGPNVGQPRKDFYFVLAIEKKEVDWKQSEWGKVIVAEANAGFPQGQSQILTFSWKVEDGDSTIPNLRGKINAERQGYKGCWVLRLSSGFAPTIVNHDGSQYLKEPGHVKPGDYIEVLCNVGANGSSLKPGVYLNHKIVAFAGFGERIDFGVDPKQVGFGKNALPVGASAVPPASYAVPASPSVPVTPLTPPAPHTAILTPPAPVAPVRQMTAAAEGHSYESLIAAGWTDALLIQHGKMVG